MRLGKGCRRGLWSAALCLLAALAMPITAIGKAGAPDRAFGGDGKIVTVLPSAAGAAAYPEYRLPYEYAAGRVAMASAPGGKLVVANSRAVIEYLADGRRNPRFGGNGAVPIVSIEGSSFQIADIAVDSKGRVLVAGTTKPKGAFGMANLSLPGPIASVASIERLQSNGLPDPTFGENGVVNTDLGVSRPTYKGQAYSGTAVGIVGVVVDQADRPILTGSAVAEVGLCPGPRKDRFERSEAIVARLTVGGAPDSTFAGNGTKSVGGLSWLGSPTVAPNGVLSVSTSANPCPRGGPGNPSVLAGLSQDGNVDQGFASSGFWSRPFTRIPNFAISSGEIFLMTRKLELKRGNWVESTPTIVGLHTDGSVDQSFGHGGRADVRLPRRTGIAAISTDGKGRVLLAGTVSRKSRHGGRRHQRLLVIRMTADGARDTTFGHHGRVTTSFGRKTNVRASDILVDSAGRIAVGGKLAGARIHNAFGIARYLGGR